MGHVMKDCPSARAFIAAPVGNGYVSASDVEDDLVLAANIFADLEEDEGEAIDSLAATADLPSLLVQRVLSSKAEHEDEEKLQRECGIWGIWIGASGFSSNATWVRLIISCS